MRRGLYTKAFICTGASGALRNIKRSARTQTVLAGVQGTGCERVHVGAELVVEEFRAAADFDRARQVAAGNEPVNAAHRDVEVLRSGGDGNECRNRTVCCRIHGFLPFAPLNTIEGGVYPEKISFSFNTRLDNVMKIL